MMFQLQGFYFPHCNVAVVTQARNNTHITEQTEGMKPTASGSAHNVSVQKAMLSLEKPGQRVHENYGSRQSIHFYRVSRPAHC